MPSHSSSTPPALTTPLDWQALQQSQLSSVQAEPTAAEDEGPEYPPMNVILTDDVTLARIREVPLFVPHGSARCRDP